MLEGNTGEFFISTSQQSHHQDLIRRRLCLHLTSVDTQARSIRNSKPGWPQKTDRWVMQTINYNVMQVEINREKNEVLKDAKKEKTGSDQQDQRWLQKRKVWVDLGMMNKLSRSYQVQGATFQRERTQRKAKSSLWSPTRVVMEECLGDPLLNQESNWSILLFIFFLWGHIRTF